MKSPGISWGFLRLEQFLAVSFQPLAGRSKL
jgi:hypothetical protein